MGATETRLKEKKKEDSPVREVEFAHPVRREKGGGPLFGF